jgi:hypothetical protein
MGAYSLNRQKSIWMATRPYNTIPCELGHLFNRYVARGNLKNKENHPMIDYIIRRKAEWQKDNCLICKKPAPLEVAFENHAYRFCGRKKCLEDCVELMTCVMEGEAFL